MSAPARLTRSERKAETRERLLEAALEVLSERGMERSSIDDIAERAGFTKGAFYTHFASKEELFLTLLDRHFAEILDRLSEVMEADTDLDAQARAGGAAFMDFIGGDPAWERLFFDFSSYATRNPAFRAELVARRTALRAGIATLVRRRVEELGIDPPVPPDQIALMVFAMADGIALERLLDPAVVSDEVYPTMLTTFFAGLQTAATAR